MKFLFLVPLLAALLVAGCGEKQEVVSFLENGEPKDGMPDGISTEYFENGQKSVEVTYKDGKPHGPAAEWYESGQKGVERSYKNGKPYGPWSEWFENGQKSAEGTYKNGEPDGLWKVWHENGQKAGEHTYKDGELVFGKYWNSKGEEVETFKEAIK